MDNPFSQPLIPPPPSAAQSLDAARYVPLGEKRSSETRASASGIAQPTGAFANDIGADDRQAAGDQIIATRLRRRSCRCETCGLNSGNLNILSEARIHAPELISDQVSIDQIDEVFCPSLVSIEVRR